MTIRKSALETFNIAKKIWFDGHDTKSDSLRGTNASEFFDGCGGRDKINGGGGNDYIVGGEERDILTGGLGADVFAWSNDTRYNDIITDFEPGIDLIHIVTPWLQCDFDDITFQYLSGNRVRVKIDPDSVYAFTDKPFTLATITIIGTAPITLADFEISSY